MKKTDNVTEICPECENRAREITREIVDQKIRAKEKSIGIAMLIGAGFGLLLSIIKRWV